MNDIEYKKLLIEALEKVEERVSPPNTMKYVKKSGTFKKYAKRSDKDTIFDVEEIISNLVKSTEYVDDSREDHYALLRSKFNTRNSYKSTEEIMAFIKSVFEVTDTVDEESCVDIGSVTARFLVNTALATIINDFNAASAGFVNERLMAGIMGGVTIPATEGSSIADIKVGNCGISLKLKKKGVSGSGIDLLRTLGIPHKYTDARGRFYDHSNVAPLYPDGLYYLIGAKTKDGKTSKVKFYCFEVDAESIKTLLPSPDANGVYILSSANKTNIEKNSFLNVGEYVKASGTENFTGKAGVSNVKISDFDLFTSEKEVNGKRKYLGETLGNTLYGLNNYLTALKLAIIQYSIQPSTSNLNFLLNALSEAQKFSTAALKKC